MTAFKVGLFIIIGLTLIIVGVVFLSAYGWKKDYIYTETYIEESVQGLEVGAPVKYRGVPIGVVTQIDFVDRKYPEIGNGFSRNVLVEMGIYPEAFEDLSNDEIHFRLLLEAQKGLRVRLKSQGLTGLAYIEADYLNPTNYPPMKITWTPEYCYVPYTPSLSAQLQESADSINVILRNLRHADLGELVSTINALVLTGQEALEKWQVDTLVEESIELVKEVKTTNKILQNSIIEANIGETTREFKKTASMLAKSVQDLNLKAMRSELSASLVEFQDTTKRFGQLLTKEEIDLMKKDFSTSLSSAKRIFENAEATVVGSLEALHMSSARFYKTTKKLEHILSTEQPNVEQIIENIKMITTDLRELTQYTKRYPSHVIFGEPPIKKEIAK